MKDHQNIRGHAIKEPVNLPLLHSPKEKSSLTLTEHQGGGGKKNPLLVGISFLSITLPKTKQKHETPNSN